MTDPPQSGRFDGTIVGVGTESGTRLVIGAWDATPFGPITDVMIERVDGHRVLIAPTAEVGRFISDTYGFDEVRVEPTSLERAGRRWSVTSQSLRVTIEVGRRTPLGRLLALVPRRVARSRWWCRAINPLARLVRPGVRTIGTAGNGREERYCALDEHALVDAEVAWDGVDRGRLRAIEPPVRFGFGSTPRRPSVVRVTTFVGYTKGMPLQLLRPRRWQPPPAPARSTERASVSALPPIRRIELGTPGPEDVNFDRDGKLLSGVGDGRLLRIDPDTGMVETIANTGGRPLGVHACADGTILVCDSRRGLLRVDPSDSSVEVLVGEVDGAPLNFASNVAVDGGGAIYFSASTRRFDLEHYTGDLLEHSGSGRLFRLDPGGRLETLLDGLDFANGVVLAPDGSCVLVAQTGGYCVTRYWLIGPKAGSSDVLIDNLPGFPDNMALGSDGLLWISLPTARNRLLDRLLPLPGVIRQAIWLLPAWTQPKPSATVWVLAVSFAGEIVHDLQGPGGDYSMVTSVIERDGTVYLGSLHETAIASFVRPV